MRALGYITAVNHRGRQRGPRTAGGYVSAGPATVPEDREDVNRPGRPRGRAPGPGAAASALTADQHRGGATFFRCGGCGAGAVFMQRERQYGRLVQGFFDRHERCGGAVDISAAQQPPAVTPGERAPAGV
jgi:hypothetical protein